MQTHKKSTILLVDDKPANILVLESLLEKKDRLFLKAESGQEALKLALSKEIDLIILDVQMPEIDGFEVSQILKSSKRTKDIPIIFASAEKRENKFIMKGFEEGAVDYLFKPLDPEITKAKVSVLLKLQMQKKELVEKNISLERSALLINNSADIIGIIDASTLKFREINQAFTSILGYTPEEINGTSLEFFLGHEDRNLIKDIKTSGQERISFETRAYCKDRSIKWLQWNVVIKGEKWFVNARDITLNKQVGKIRDSLSTIVRQSNDAIYIHDENGQLISWNEGAQRIYGYTEREALKMNIWNIIPEYLHEKTQHTIEKLIEGEDFQFMETKRITKHGKLVDVFFSASVIIDPENGNKSVAITERDITQQKIAEEQILQLNENLKINVHNAETANRTKSQFLANMSHEIRTPLNAVIGLSHLALKTDLSPKQTDYLQKIQSSSESLLGIINDILDFSKIESGKLVLEEVNFDLEEVLQKLADVITYKAQAKGLEIAFGIDSNVPTCLIGDAARLEQVLSNLCSNAVKFTDRGEVVIGVSLLEGDGSDCVKLQFRVQDTGIGMNQKQISKLFQPFTQADETISRKYGGTGLGLSIIKRLVDLMGGDVSVTSELGKGSNFTFTICAKKQKNQRKIPVPAIDLRELNVLLVDDNKSSLKIIKEALESFSFNVIAVDSGIQAIHYLKNNYNNKQMKVLLMDWKMPDMDGLQAASIIRQDPQFSDIRIIMMSNSYAPESLYKRTEDLQLSAIVMKPMRYSMLYNSIMDAVQSDKIANNPEAPKKDTAKELIPQAILGHILLVEDNEINQQVASELLEGFGYTSEVASNGIEAIEMVQKSGSPSKYQMVLMDLQMPVMGGIKATEKIRKLREYQQLPIIAMTADAMVGVKEKCLSVGMLDFITKPINPKQMLETIEKWMPSGEKAVKISSPKQTLHEVKIPALDGIDIDDGLNRLGANTKLYYELLLKFQDNHSNFIADLTTKLTTGKQEEAQRLLHTVKGLSGNLGMTKLHEVCKKTEQHLKSTNRAHTTDVIGPLSEEMNKVLASLNKQLVRDHKEPDISGPSGPPDIKPMLNDLEALLKNSDPEAVRLLKEMGMTGGYEKEIKKMSKHLQNYDFEQALVILAKIKAKIK